MKNKILAFAFLFVIINPINAQQDEAFQQLLKDFVSEYPKLNIPALKLSYVDNLNSIQNEAIYFKSERFF